jgi:hypothetical protein
MIVAGAAGGWMVVRTAEEWDSPTSLVNERRGEALATKEEQDATGQSTQLRGAHIANYSFAFY